MKVAPPILGNTIQTTTIAMYSQNKNPSKRRVKNIARGTTDPEIDSVTWIDFNNMAPLALVENLTTRWRHLH